MTTEFIGGEVVKYKLIDSIAKSQMALARILNSLADLSDTQVDTARHLAQNIEILAKYQNAMARSVCGISLHRVHYGTPSSPWITKSCYKAIDATQGVQEDVRK